MEIFITVNKVILGEKLQINFLVLTELQFIIYYKFNKNKINDYE